MTVFVAPAVVAEITQTVVQQVRRVRNAGQGGVGPVYHNSMHRVIWHRTLHCTHVTITIFHPWWRLSARRDEPIGRLSEAERRKGLRGRGVRVVPMEAPTFHITRACPGSGLPNWVACPVRWLQSAVRHVGVCAPDSPQPCLGQVVHSWYSLSQTVCRRICSWDVSRQTACHDQNPHNKTHTIVFRSHSMVFRQRSLHPSPRHRGAAARTRCARSPPVRPAPRVHARAARVGMRAACARLCILAVVIHQSW